eukprot:3164200-Prymnesium_polylepis.1
MYTQGAYRHNAPRPPVDRDSHAYPRGRSHSMLQGMAPDHPARPAALAYHHSVSLESIAPVAGATPPPPQARGLSIAPSLLTRALSEPSACS